VTTKFVLHAISLLLYLLNCENVTYLVFMKNSKWAETIIILEFYKIYILFNSTAVQIVCFCEIRLTLPVFYDYLLIIKDSFCPFFYS